MQCRSGGNIFPAPVACNTTHLPISLTKMENDFFPVNFGPNSGWLLLTGMPSFIQYLQRWRPKINMGRRAGRQYCLARPAPTKQFLLTRKTSFQRNILQVAIVPLRSSSCGQNHQDQRLSHLKESYRQNMYP